MVMEGLCDVCSLKVSLLQGREWKWEGKGTPELTDYAYSCFNGLEVRGCEGCQ
jgi:hypothetical protein